MTEKSEKKSITSETFEIAALCSKRGRFVSSEINLPESALLVVDVQEYFFNPESSAHIAFSGAIIGNILKSIEFLRGRNRPIIFTRHAEKRDSPEFPKNRTWRSRLFEDMPESNFYRELPINCADKILIKNTFSAFHGNDLESFLKSRGVRFVFMVGVNTHICIESSARDAFDCGFLPVILADACASWKAEQHLRSLKNISDGIGWITDCSQLMELA